MSNISNFIASFSNSREPNELARPYNYDVSIFPTSSLFSALTSSSITSKIVQGGILFKGRELKFRCESAELPSRTFGIIEQKTYGPVERFPITNSFEPINLTFICSDSMSEKLFFDYWMESISTSHPGKSLLGALGDAVGISTGVRYDFEYKDNYTSTIAITQYDVTGNSSYLVTLMEAFPYSVNQMPLAWSQANQYHRINVSFYYKYFISTPLTSPI